MNGAHACLTQDRRRTARNALVEEELHDVVGVTTVSSANIAAAYASAWSDVLVLQLGVVRSELFPRRVGAQCFEHTAYRQAHSTDTGLAVHLSRLDGPPEGRWYPGERSSTGSRGYHLERHVSRCCRSGRFKRMLSFTPGSPLKHKPPRVELVSKSVRSCESKNLASSSMESVSGFL